jgi:hypothetical protein
MLGRLAKWFRDRQLARRERLMPESQVVVTVDAESIRVASPDGTLHQVLWRDLVRVSIETNDSGPRDADFWWIVEGTRGRCSYPQGATGESEAMTALGDQPGFDWSAVTAASASTTNARFICWEKKA